MINDKAYIVLLDSVHLVTTVLLFCLYKGLEFFQFKAIEHIGDPFTSSFDHFFFGWQVLKNLGIPLGKGD